MSQLRNNKDAAKWMSDVPDEVKLCELTLPGTHDSCAFAGNLLARCQHMSLEEQLHSGVRYVDVRCRHMNDRFELYHSSFSLGDFFDTGVIVPVVSFLKQNPSETIIMLVSPEHKQKNNKKSFDDQFLEYINDTNEFWHLDGNQMPILGQTRGKIVLLRRLNFWHICAIIIMIISYINNLVPFPVNFNIFY